MCFIPKIYSHIELAINEFERAGGQVHYEVSDKIKIFIMLNQRKKIMIASKTPQDGNAVHQIHRQAKRLIAQMKQ